MSTTFSSIFYLKKPKNYVGGQVPIYLRITIEGQRAEISTGREVMADRWSSAAGRGNGTKEDIKALNAYLETLQAKLYEAHRLLLLEGGVMTAEVLKNKFTGKGQKPRMLVPIFKQHNEEMKALIGKDFAFGTWERFSTALSHGVEFMRHKYRLSDIDIRRIDHAFIKDYEFYLKSVRNCNHNTAMKYITNLKKIVLLCLANGWISTNPFAMFKIRIDEVDKVFLFENELQQLMQKQYNVKRLGQVRDIFVFCCYTGLAYSDVKKLASEHITLGIDGYKWIFLNRTKTGVPSRIPLLPIAEELLARYKDSPECTNSGRLLPVLSNQKMNSYLKEVGDLAGLNKKLTMHVARHTFATTVTLTNDVPIESVSKMLGHKVIKQTEYYAKVVDKKISRDMMQLREKFKTEEPGTSLSITG